ncbi:MAG: ABC-2 family transporter protein [Oscillospiraceae bacterium]|jgi:ABC-2 type transport system permease protein|nr:ABC-2 family transporter protein [Oscillospiraceae bacterium]
MKKYFAVAAISFKVQLVYRFDVATNALEIAGRVLFAWLLWSAAFAGRGTVGGFELPDMLFYYVISAFLASLNMSGGVSREVSDRIRGGTFSKFMVIPANAQWNFWAQTMGASSYYAIYGTAVTLLCAALFRIKPLFTADPAAVVCGVLLVPLGLTFMVCYHYFIGILAFKFQDIGFFLHVQNALLEFVTGGVVPLILLPGRVISALRFLPFTHTVYTPAMLLMGKADTAEGLFAICSLAAWTLAMAAANHFVYRRLRIKYDGVGI